ncbi:terminase large subunit [Sphingomonadaceae bacterium G21617-S1]|nr:terminase large subunit [Sphingomonadaceae bacterium G21617-S1]
MPTLPLFDAEAARALRVFKRLRIPDVIGTPTMAEACGPWFFPIVAALLGSYDPETNRRMIQELFLLIPKGNSKSSTGGALMLTAVIVNRRPEAEFSIVAPTMRVANVSFKQAMDTIRIDPELDKLFHIQKHIRTITHRTTGAQLQIKAADTDVVTGGKPVGTLIDETHVFANKANAADIFVELRGALGKRPDGFLIQTTTQSKVPPHGVFKAELESARAVRDGRLDLPLLPILYEYPEHMLEDGSWRERKHWHFVNPNMGRSIDEPFLERELMKATEGPQASAEQLMLIASQHFNVEIGLRLRGDGWANAVKYWQARADTALTLDELIERSEVIVAGVDGGGLDDLEGLALIGRCKETRNWLLWNHAWAHPDVFELRPEIVPHLEDFIADGHLTLCENATDDIIGVAEIIQRVRDAGLLPEKYGIGLDPVGIAALVEELDRREMRGELLASITQGYKLSGAIWGMERKLKDGTLWHAGQAMMKWCLSNAKAEQKGNAIVITKQTAGKAKIDPLVASFNAIDLMSRNPVAAGATAFEYTGM